VSRPASLAQFRVLSFDCYGTLIDWETGILDALEPLRAKSAVRGTDQEILSAFGAYESALEAEHPSMPYSELLGMVHERLAQRLGSKPDPEAAKAFGSSVGCWPAFADSAEALRRLKQRYVLVILSNVDRAGFAGSQSRLGIEFDHVFTAEDIGSYKPSLRNFEYMMERLAAEGFAKEEILHTAQSLFHDHAPANRVGLHSAWINRQAGRPGATPTLDPMPRFDYEFADLKSLADAVEAKRV